LLANEIQTVLICRELNYSELDSIHKQFVEYPKMFKIATDGLLFIVNAENPIKKISVDELEKVLSGEIADWKQLTPAWSSNAKIIPVTTPYSSTSRYLTYLKGSPSPIMAYKINTTEDVLSFVQKNKQAIGVIGGSWLLQRSGRYEGVKIVAHALPDSLRQIPEVSLYREVFVVTQEPFSGLGNGFVAFLASERGQLVLSKEGMLPYRPITREFELSE
jgi:phosphate transport system substrate-binding protein